MKVIAILLGLAAGVSVIVGTQLALARMLGILHPGWAYAWPALKWTDQWLASVIAPAVSLLLASTLWRRYRHFALGMIASTAFVILSLLAVLVVALLASKGWVR
jgi:hypothetical protein